MSPVTTPTTTPAAAEPSSSAPADTNAPQAETIIRTAEGPFPHVLFDTTDLYQGPAVLHGVPSWLDVYAGGPSADPANPGTVVTGGVWVFRMGSSSDYVHLRSLGTFLARKGSGEITIVAAHGSVLTLRTSRGRTEWLDLRTLTYRYA